MQDIVNIYKSIEVENIPSFCFIFFLVFKLLTLKKQLQSSSWDKKNKIHITFIVKRDNWLYQIPTKEL